MEFSKDLYSLPKDILVKLISTIREDTIKEVTKTVTNKYEKDKEELFDLIEIYLIVSRCDETNCESKAIGNYTSEFYKCKTFYKCNECRSFYCDKHIIYKNDIKYCPCGSDDLFDLSLYRAN